MTEPTNTNGNGRSKDEINYHAPTREFDNNTSLITNIGFTAKVLEKYQIVWPIPSTDEEAKARYDCSLAKLVEAGVRQLTTRCDYKSVGFFNPGEIVDGKKLTKDDPRIGTLKPNGHEAMQSLADGYTVGARTTGGMTQKVYAQKAKNAETELGMTMEQMVAKMKELKEAGMLED